jgi:solute carrier family 30 (zinc transporter), member 5/7
MQGIFLHILADALGSVAVIFSTLLTKWNGWNGWDPLASSAIAVLIFLSAIPLVKSSGKRLLLALPDELEYSCRGVLQGIGQLRGVVGYAGVKFWKADQEGDGGHSHHSHDEHSHGLGHSHDHGDHEHCPTSKKEELSYSVQGVMHIIAGKSADLEDVRERTAQYLKSRGMDIVLQVEREGEGKCWCGGKKG